MKSPPAAVDGNPGRLCGPDTVHDLTAARIWGIIAELAACVMRRSQNQPGSPVAMNLMTAWRSWPRKLVRSTAMSSKPLSREAAPER